MPDAPSVPTAPSVTPPAPVAPPSPLDALGQAMGWLQHDPIGAAGAAIGHIGQAAGGALGAVPEAISAPFAPIKAGAQAISHVPLGWLPGGADEGFRTLGDYMQKNDPAAYDEWLKVKAASDADVFGGGNTRADFNREWVEKYAERSKSNPFTQSAAASVIGLGSAGTLAREYELGAEGFGSLGGALAHGLMGGLNLLKGVIGVQVAGSGAGGSFGGLIQQAIMTLPATSGLVKATNSGQDAARLADTIGKNRLEALQAQDPSTLGDVEKHVVDQVNSGAWDENHALTYLVVNSKSFSDDFLTQMIGEMATDPLNYIVPGAGALSKAGLKTGAKLAESGLLEKGALETALKGGLVTDTLPAGQTIQRAVTTYERLSLLAHEAQTGPAGGAFRIARGLWDPLGVMPQKTASEGLKDLMTGGSIKAFERAFGPKAFQNLWRRASKHGFTDALDSAVGNYTVNQGRLLTAVENRATQMSSNLGESLIHSTPDDALLAGVHAQPRDYVDNLTDLMQRTSHNIVTGADRSQLAERLAIMTGRSATEWGDDIGKMSLDELRAWHAITYQHADGEFNAALAAVDRAAYTGELPLGKAVLMNSNTLDEDTARGIVQEIADAGSTAEKTRLWNDYTDVYMTMQDLGHANGVDYTVDKLVGGLQKQIDDGRLIRAATPEELAAPGLGPVQDFLGRNTSGSGTPLWRVGFRPDEEVAWGLQRHPVTGRLMVERDPTISHVFEGAPSYRPFSETTRNALGQIIGKRAAGAASRPVESVEAFLKTAADQVSGRRLVNNIERRFEYHAVTKWGLSRPVAREIMKAARDAVGWESTTIKGLSPQNLWKAAGELVPQELRTTLDQHQLLDGLLWAAEGDMRIMGVSSKFTQRARNMLRRAGADPVNMSGQMTVTAYNKLRYGMNPTFQIQRVTDGSFYAAIQGVMPVGRTLTPELEETGRIMETLGRTSLGRDFAFDLPEYANKTNFMEGVLEKVKVKAGLSKRLEAIQNTPNIIVRNGMINLLHKDLGNVVRETADEMRVAIERVAKEHPEMAAQMLDDLDNSLLKSFANVRQHFSEIVGRPLAEKEASQAYIKQQFASALRQKATDTGVDITHVLAEGHWSKPSNIGEVQPLPLDELARELGYANKEELRVAITPTGDKNVAWLRDVLKEHVMAHPDAVKRIENALTFRWDSFWEETRSGLGISTRLTKELQGVIGRAAQLRGMDPGEYLSQVMMTNVRGSVDGELAKVVQVLKAGKAGNLKQLSGIYHSHMDLSQQRTLVDAFVSELEGPGGLIQKAYDAGDAVKGVELNRLATTLKGGTAESGGAIKAAPSLPEPWRSSPYAAKTEEVPVSVVSRFMEIDREVTPKFRGDFAALDELTADIKANGFKEPIILDYDPEHGLALLGEGNHRLAAAKRLGLDSVPMRVVKTNLEKDPKAVSMAGFEAKLKPNEHGYFPADSRPSDIGLPVKPEAAPVVDTSGAAYDEAFDAMLADRIAERATSGVPHANPEVEGAFQHFSKWAQTALPDYLREHKDVGSKYLWELVGKIPMGGFAFNHTEALIENLLRSKIELLSKNAFTLAEMSTSRNVLMRSINHPVFGVYPAAYMWGKVLPQSLKFFMRNPYAATYNILDVERAIAVQREIDPEFADAAGTVDNSEMAFLAGYLTPSLPWEDQQASMAPLYRSLAENGGINISDISKKELSTISPERWYNSFLKLGAETGDFLGSLGKEAPPPAPSLLDTLPPAQPVPTASPSGAGQAVDIQGHVAGTALQPVLSFEMEELQRVLGNQ